MHFRIAAPSDISQIQIVRNSVNENQLSDPSYVTDDDCYDYLVNRGRGWVYEIESRVVAFAIGDLQEKSIWALFVEPDFEGLGIAQKLQLLLLHWYFGQSQETIWLTTSPETRAEKFYRKSGWIDKGMQHNGELRFEMTYLIYKQLNGAER